MKRFKNDVVKIKCKDGKIREAIITQINGDGTYNVAYADGFGCQNLEVIEEEQVHRKRLQGASLRTKTILPFKLGDLVEYHLNDDDYYLAHIVEIGKKDTVKILLGDVYMGQWVRDRKKGDYQEVNVEDIKWIDHCDGVDFKRLAQYGYEREELWRIQKEQKKEKNEESRAFFKQMGKRFAIIALVLATLGPVAYHLYNSEFIEEEEPAVEYTYDIDDYIHEVDLDNYTKPYMIAVEGTMYERIVGMIYGKQYADVTDEEKNAITSMNIEYYATGEGDDMEVDYSIKYKVLDSPEYSIVICTPDLLDAYRLSELQGVTSLTLRSQDLKTVEFLSEMENVEYFAAADTGVKDFSPLANTNIKYLSLVGNDQAESYDCINDMPQLLRLELTANKDLIAEIDTELPELEELWLDGTYDLSILKNMPSLKRFHFGHQMEYNWDTDIKPILECETLEEVDLQGLDAYSNDASQFFGMKNLKSLELNKCYLNIDFSKIPENENLKELTIIDCLLMNNVSTQKSGGEATVYYDELSMKDNLDFLKGFSNLTSLTINGMEIEDCSSIAELPQLENLDLTDNYITDISPLRDLDNLEKLVIKNNPLSAPAADAGLSNRVEISE